MPGSVIRSGDTARKDTEKDTALMVLAPKRERERQPKPSAHTRLCKEVSGNGMSASAVIKQCHGREGQRRREEASGEIPSEPGLA